VTVHLLKMCVGVDSVEQLIDFQEMRRRQFVSAGLEPEHVHVTRNRPRRDVEVLDGGSLYWIIKGQVRVRQRIMRLDEVIGEDGKRRCGLVMAHELVRTLPRPARPMQGWRYLEADAAPGDLPDGPDAGDGGSEMPEQMREELRELGLL
jgi:hypothetical protein